MIKRPFLLGIVVFVGGILLAWNNVPILYVVLMGLIGWLIIFFLMFRVKRFINQKDYFIWGLPILLLLGFLAMTDMMKPPDIDKAFEEKSDCSLAGEISMIVKKPWGTAYYLKDTNITLPDKSTYFVEKIIVNSYQHEYQQNHNHIENQIGLSQEYRPGNIIAVSGIIKKFSTNANPGGFNEYLYYKAQNISYKVTAKKIHVEDSRYSKFRYVLGNIKEELLQTYMRILPEKEAGIVIAMVLGEKYLLDDEVRDLYQGSGISHILAISGLHISLVGAAIYIFLRKLRLGLIASTVLSLAVVYSYGVLTNFSVSTNRAVVMYSVMLFARIIGKTFDILSALSLSAFLILLQNPIELFQPGFLLSFSAILGIASILPTLNSLHEAKNTILKSIYVSVSAQTISLPIVLYYFFQFQLYSVLINLIVIPLTSLLMLTVIIAGIAGIISKSLGVFIAGGANYILRFYETVCRLGSNAPGSLITVGRPEIIRISAYFILLSVFVLCVRRYGKKRFLILYIAAVAVFFIPKPRDGLAVTMLDVGQGEAIFMESDSGTTYLIDGGSSDVNQVGRYRITPYLLAKGTDTINYAIVTHADIDHISGLMELMEGRRITIESLVLPNTSFKNELYLKLEKLAQARSVKIIYVVAGDKIIDGKLRMTFLHPPMGYQPDSNNDYSTVISINYDEFDMLLTGDIEAKGEQELIKFMTEQIPMQADYDVLKCAHHGSRNSTSTELLTVIKPEIAIISCGKNNRYGHPHEELLERLQRYGAEVKATTESGAITIKTDGKRMVVTRGRGELSRSDRGMEEELCDKGTGGN